MSDVPVPPPPHPAPALAPVRAPLFGRPPPRRAATRDDIPWLSQALLVGGAALTMTHLFFGRADFELRDRVLAVIPLFPLLWEIHRFHKVPRGTQLPFAVYALLMNYITFSWPALFNTVFTDLSGPVVFGDEVRFLGTAAVALSAVMIYIGILLGEKVGLAGRPYLLRASPPAAVTPSFPHAVGAYALGCMIATQAVTLGAHYPAAVGVLITMSFSITYVIGATLAKPESFRGPWSRYLAGGVVMLGVLSGLLRGVLEPLFRLTTTLIAVRWAHLRRFSILTVVAMMGLYTLLQPAKAQFRAQTWIVRGEEQTAGYADRVTAWTTAITDVWTGRDAGQTGDAAVNRFLELDPILHAFSMLPGRVRPANGEAWASILYSPIPRIVWPDKPNSNDLSLNYGVAFRLQSELGARSTTILMPLIVDGYWNFGWPGIVFVSVMAGLWVGICQTLYAGTHWALQASAVAQFSLITVTGSFALLYAGITQQILGTLIASWMVYWLMRLLTVREANRGKANFRTRPPSPGVKTPGYHHKVPSGD
jgi:hypothetical protein